jgi:hypothetical protein
MKEGNTSTWIFVGLLLSCALFFHLYSGPQTRASRHVSPGQESEAKKSGSMADGLPAEVSGKVTDRHGPPNKDALAKPNEQQLLDLFNGDGELNETALGSHGLGKAQIDAIKEVFDEISKEISEHFVKNCSEEVIHDGSFVYVLKGDPELSLALKDKMRTRLREVIETDSSGADLADQLTEGVKGRMLLNFGADDMIGAAYRDVDKARTGWEDGIRINGKMPGMIDYYRKNGWPDGANIHESGGKAIFRPIGKSP